MGPTPCDSQSQIVSMPVALFFFRSKIPFFGGFIEFRKWCGHIDMLMTFSW